MTVLEIVFLSLFLVVATIVIYLFISSEIKYWLTLKKGCLFGRIIYRYTIKTQKKYKIDLSWWKTQKVEEIDIISHDKLKLKGYFLHKNDKKIAVVVHGYGTCAFAMQQYVKMFFDFGYSVLAIDNRAHGISQGKCITMGYFEHKDLGLWVDYLVKRYKDSEIVVFGLSMGGATVCLYSRDKKPNNVKAIISDCAYSNAYDVVQNLCEQSIILNFFPSLFVYNQYLKLRAKFKLSDIDVKSSIQKCNVPILLIHGSRDKFVPFYMQEVLYKNAPPSLCQKYVVQGAGHAESMTVAGEDYINAVKKFLSPIIK